MLSLILALALQSNPNPAAPSARERVLVLDFKVAGAPAEMGSVVANVVAVELGELSRFDVFTSKDMRALLDREAVKQGIGCDDSGDSCLAELAGALGAKLVVYGDVSKLDTAFLVNVNLFDASRAIGLGRANVEVSSADQLPDRIGAAVRKLVNGDPGMGPLHVVGITGLALGGALATAGTIGAILAFNVETDATALGTDKQAALDTHPVWSITAAAGALVAVTGGALFGAALWSDP